MRLLLSIFLLIFPISVFSAPVILTDPTFWDLPAGQPANNNVQLSYLLSSTSNVNTSVDQYCNAFWYTYVSHTATTGINQRRFRWNTNQWQWVRTANQSTYIDTLTCDDGQVFWCTDINAINYDPLATVDDWSCQYSNSSYPQGYDIWIWNANNFGADSSDQYLLNLTVSNYCKEFGAEYVVSYDTVPWTWIPVNRYDLNPTWTGATQWELATVDTHLSDIQCALAPTVISTPDDRVLSFYNYIMILTWIWIMIYVASFSFWWYKKMYMYLARLVSMK